MKAKSILMTIAKIVIPFAILAGCVLFSAFILMLLWNSFLVSAVGVSTISLWQAVLGWVFVYFITAIVGGAKQVLHFIQMVVMARVVNWQVQKQMKQYMETQGDLAKHFGFPFAFGKENEKENEQTN